MKDILTRDIQAFQNNLQQLGAALAQLREERNRLDKRITELEEAEKTQQTSLQYANALMETLKENEKGPGDGSKGKSQNPSPPNRQNGKAPSRKPPEKKPT